MTAGTRAVLGAMLAAACEPPHSPAPPPAVPIATAPLADAGAPVVPADAGSPAIESIEGRGPGFAETGPWVSFYGTAAQMGDLKKVAARFRIINVDADPGMHNFSDAQLKTLKAGGKNRVLSYLNFGACETYRTYWSSAPPGLVACGKSDGRLGEYAGFPDETWMNPADPGWAKLVTEHIAPRLAARGVDGFFLDNVELLDHGVDTKSGPCSASCVRGGLDLVRRLREKYPELLIVQNGPSAATRTGTTGGLPYPAMIDGIVREEVYAPRYDEEAENELLLWKALPFRSRHGRPLWIGVQDYVGSCKNRAAARAAMDRAAARGFSATVGDDSGALKAVCWW